MCESDLIPIGELFPQTGKYLQIRNTTLTLTALSSFLLPPFLLHCVKANFPDITFYCTVQKLNNRIQLLEYFNTHYPVIFSDY